MKFKPVLRAGAILAILLFTVDVGGLPLSDRGRPAESDPQMLTIDQNDDGRSIPLATGQRLELALPETPSTGYRWVAEAPATPCVVTDEGFRPASRAPGSAGTHVWSIESTGPGVARLRWSLRRAGETKAVRSFVIDVATQPEPR